MLTSLHIENIAVIERANIEFERGLNIMTGETGAGKSIIIDSLSAVLGGRVSREIVRSGEDRAVVSATFTATSASEAFLEENELETGEELILWRKIGSDGKSSCRVNGMPVTAAQLRSLGSLLLDIHGQNDGRKLLDEASHLAFLDAFGALDGAKAEYKSRYDLYTEAKKEIAALTLDEREKQLLSETLSRTAEELEGANLREGEYDELTALRDMMKNSEKLTEAMNGAYEALNGDGESALALVSEALELTRRASAYNPALEETETEISDARFMLEDAAERIGETLRSLDFSPEEYERVEGRIALLKRLFRKYGGGEKELLLKLEESRRRLDDIQYAEDRLMKLEKTLSERHKAALEAGARLTAERKRAAAELSARVESELKALNMPSARFEVEISPVGGEDGLSPRGCDEVRFLMSANAGEDVGRISRIASGGELSRIMLALKSVFSAFDGSESMVFDEIDSGVSGIAARRVGEKLCALAADRQVICITHLPQIAAFADCHFLIEKSEQGGHTRTSVTRLDRAGRLGELARLYGGDVVTPLTLKSAEEQLEAAEAGKKERRV